MAPLVQVMDVLQHLHSCINAFRFYMDYSYKQASLPLWLAINKLPVVGGVILARLLQTHLQRNFKQTEIPS